MANYATLRVAATHLDLSSLQASRLQTEHIAWPRPSFNFNYGDFVRWLGGEYMGAQRDWDATFDIVDSVRTSSVPPGYPAIDFDCAIQLATEGAPLAGHFECSFVAVQQHERHNNASLTPEAIAHVRKKCTKEEKLSYHILFPRFIWAFIPGLFLALITWIPP